MNLKMIDDQTKDFRNIIMNYNEERISDPFMEWFRQQDKIHALENNFERILVILIDARFDQQTRAENALKNTIMVYEVEALKKKLERSEIPTLIPRNRKTAQEWTDLFHKALPKLHRLALIINEKEEWSAGELLRLMRDPEYKVPYLAVKTSRLAVRWLHELIDDLEIDMSDFKIPVDKLVYRVASRLGIIDPYTDKYHGDGSPADLKIQSFAESLFPENSWFLDEPMWSTGRRRSDGGHCYPKLPDHEGCIFEEICPKKYVDFDPADIGMDKKTSEEKKSLLTLNEELTITEKQKKFNEFVKQLKEQGIRGEEYRRRIMDWSEKKFM